MIDAIELRIGNWVADNRNFVDSSLKGKFIEVDSVGFGGINLSCGAGDWGLGVEVEDKYLDGIPLTTEILEKCLTKVNDKEFRIEIPVEWSKTHHTEYWFYVKLYEYYATGEAHVGWRPWVKQGTTSEITEIFLWGYLEYVHQLQNFYHSVCQSELLIKL